MKLAYDLRYATDHFPGIGTHAWGLGRELAARGVFEQLVMLWDSSVRNTRFDVDALRAHAGLRIQEMDVPALSWRTASGTGRWLERLGTDAYLSPFWLRPERTRVPCVLTVHDVLPLLPGWGGSWLRRWAFRWEMRRTAAADAVLTSTRFSRDEILRHTGIRPERLHTAPLGIAAPGPARRRPAGAPEPPFALLVGPGRPHKGHDTLASVWRALGCEPPLPLVAAGSRVPGHDALAEVAAEGGSVHALGAVTPDELEWLYANATLVLIPSRYEGFGLPLLEAGARGAAVIASDIPALREIGEGAARFVAVDDVAAWTRAVRELAADPEARARMGRAGRAQAAEYDYRQCAERVEAVVRAVVERRGPRPA